MIPGPPGCYTNFRRGATTSATSTCASVIASRRILATAVADYYPSISANFYAALLTPAVA
jgi:hypothetical protein